MLFLFLGILLGGGIAYRLRQTRRLRETRMVQTSIQNYDSVASTDSFADPPNFLEGANDGGYEHIALQVVGDE